VSPGVTCEVLQPDGGYAGVAHAVSIGLSKRRSLRPVVPFSCGLSFKIVRATRNRCCAAVIRRSRNLFLDLLSWEYHETLMAGAGKQAEAALERVVREHTGEYIAVVEGAIPTADGGVYCTIGGKTALDIATRVCSNAAVNIAVGACAWDGGLVRSNPNPTGALGLHEAVPGLKNLINLGGCPHNPANAAAVLVHYLTFHDLPALDEYNRPLFAYGDIIHDQCDGELTTTLAALWRNGAMKAIARAIAYTKWAARVLKPRTTVPPSAGMTERVGR